MPTNQASAIVRMTSSALHQSSPVSDPTLIKSKQQTAWLAGDYAIVSTTLQIVGESLCESLDVRSGQKLLDVAAGNGNATRAAARHWCYVTSTDYVPALLERSRGSRRRT